MRKMMWIYLVILFLSEARSMEPVASCKQPTVNINRTNVTTHVNNNASLSEYRYEVVNNGSDVNLTCSDMMWNETFYVMWDIKLNNKKHCKITISSDGQNIDSCKDGKSLRNTSSTQPYLHIPKFSKDDVGVYKCDFAFRGGATIREINVAIADPPKVDAWLEYKSNTTVAVCQAISGYPVNISWSHTEGFPVQKEIRKNGLITVESHLELTESIDPNNLSCTISRQNWKKILFPKYPPGKGGYVSWHWILIALMIFVFLVGFLLFLVIKLRQCQQSDIAPSKSTPLEDVEEVEPYASYVQRVNSIYN